MSRDQEIAKGLVESGITDTVEAVTNSDRNPASRITTGALGLLSVGIGATVGLIGLGVRAAKNASEKSEDSFCTQCGSHLLENTHFCVKCGCAVNGA